MIDRDDIPGLKWWKFDFHSHTPTSDSYGGGKDQQRLKQRTPREWLLDYMKAGIDCLAITDHNSSRWIDALKHEYDLMQQESPLPNGFRPLPLFPGVEISANGGVHLLAIFDYAATTSEIDRLLGAVGYQGASGNCDSVDRSDGIDFDNTGRFTATKQRDGLMTAICDETEQLTAFYTGRNQSWIFFVTGYDNDAAKSVVEAFFLSLCIMG